MPTTILPPYCTPSPVTDLELQRRRAIHGLDDAALEAFPTLRRLLARRAPEGVHAADLEVARLPVGALRTSVAQTGLVTAAGLDELLRCAVERTVAEQRSRLGAAHAWGGVDAHALLVLTEALAQAVEDTLHGAGAGREAAALFRRLLALDQGVRMDGYTFALAQLGTRDAPSAALRPESFLRALDRELSRAYRRAEGVALLRAVVAPSRELETVLRDLVAAAERSARRTDLVGRTTARELCVALPGADRAGALRFVSRWVAPGNDEVAVAIGVAAPGAPINAAELLASVRQAEPALVPGVGGGYTPADLA